MRDKYVKELGRNDKNGESDDDDDDGQFFFVSKREKNVGNFLFFFLFCQGTSTVDHPPDSFFGLMSFLNPFIKRKSSNHSNG